MTRKTALLIAFHFPPAAGSSGVHRAYSLARYLPDEGWEPVVLTPKSFAHPRTSEIDRSIECEDATVYRAFGLDAARHLSIAGRYPDCLAWPDRWVSWWPAAVLRGLQIVRRHKPKVIWSTYPIATSHLIGRTLSRLTGLPWVADFRDSMTDDVYPPSGVRRRLFQRIERSVVSAADKVVFTAPGTQAMYARRFPDLLSSHWELNLNGYDEDAFLRAEGIAYPEEKSKTVILHSGVIYPEERDPAALFSALSSLRDSGKISERTLEVRLRSTGHDELFSKMLHDRQLDGLVKLLPPISYELALAEMLAVDGLLLLQAPSCNHQIPAKLYEYFRAKRPILALTDKRGDTASLLSRVGGGVIAPLDSPNDIADALVQFIDKITAGEWKGGSDSLDDYSRKAQASRTARLFDRMSTG